jgi:fatty-acyl-CoA synthase
MFKLLRELNRIRLLTPLAPFRIVAALLGEGMNLLALARLTARLHPDRTALIDDREQVTYPDLYQQARNLAAALHFHHNLRRGQRIAIMCRNHASILRAILAVSKLGATIYLLNPEITAEQFGPLAQRHRFDFCIHDEEAADLIRNSPFAERSLPAYHDSGPSLDRLAKTPPNTHVRLGRPRSGNIVVLTGGTSGQPKAASRKPGIVNFLAPFFALLTRANLGHYRSVYIATPIYHGFGIAAVIMALVLGGTMYLRRRFDAASGCALIQQHRIEVVPLVPLMLQRMLNHDSQALEPLACILAGGAALNPALVVQANEALGPRLLNLYGTSEAGFCILATPEDLRVAPGTIGKPIAGVKASIRGPDDKPVPDGSVGRLCIRSRWTITPGGGWVETGDLAYRDQAGYYHLCGRLDDMVVSGGENVYPVELENILIQHPDIRQVAVIGVPDPEFGQRLKALVVKAQDSGLDEPTLRAWIKERAARHQVPRDIEFREDLPYTPLGKPDKKRLKADS